MSMPYFIFNNINSLDYLTVNELPPIVRAERNIDKIEIPGRDGFLTEDYGTYKGIPKPVKCTIKDLSQIDYINSWLTGSGDVIFSNEPDKVYKGTIINSYEFAKILLTWHNATIQFDCQPHKYSIDNSIITLTTSGTVFNPGTANSKLVIKIYGTGSIDLTINGSVIHLTNVVDYVTIDSSLMDCYKDTNLKNNYMSGDFPEFILGENTISWTGTVTKIEITPNWRYL